MPDIAPKCKKSNEFTDIYITLIFFLKFLFLKKRLISTKILSNQKQN